MNSGALFTRPARVRCSWLILLVLFGSTLHAQGLEIIDLKYRTAAEVIPVLQPLLTPADALTGSDYTLFVRASPATLGQLRSVLAMLDREPRQLLVSVRRGARAAIEREAVAASAVAASARVQDRDASAAVLATNDTDARDSASVASVRVLEGGTALINTAQSVPLVTAFATGGGRRPWTAASMSYRDLDSGFLVTPRLSGDGVTLEIEQRHERPRSGSGNIETQAITTQVRGQLGQWIELGGMTESATAQRSGILDRSYATRSDSLGVWVRVEAQ